MIKAGRIAIFSKAQIKRQMKKLSAIYYRRALTNKDFTIISNNCWGGGNI